ncbi:MAG TPA: hypothetical protein VFI90_13330 [Rubrobacter sp.]|nr:hypothetical protein [Rubrobacter sp.]
MEAQKNPFVYGRPISREEEKRILAADVLSGQPVMMHAPRRYGKTSLVRVVARKLLEENEMPFVYVDLWGARSITDLVEVLGEALNCGTPEIYRLRGGRERGTERAIRAARAGRFRTQGAQGVAARGRAIPGRSLLPSARCSS